ncbi:MAG: tetratricopeptide repeat protein [Methylotetracoccus sp.]
MPLSAIGSDLFYLGQYHQALDHHRKALDINQAALPAGHQHIAFCLHAIGDDLANLGEYDRWHWLIWNARELLAARPEFRPDWLIATEAKIGRTLTWAGNRTA